MERRHQSAPLFLVGALFLFCAGVWSVVYAQSPAALGVLTFAVLNVGQGDALYIESPTGVQVLIDGGPDSSVLQELAVLMPSFDRSVDAIIATHPDADHIGGLVDIIERYSVGVFIEPGIFKNTATAKTLAAAVDEKRVPRVIARRGMVLDLGAGVRLEILYPDHDVSGLPGEKANEGGVVARLVYGESEVLLTADVGTGVESHLVQLDGAALQGTLLKVGHHGSKYSTSKKFVEMVSPEVALISVGKNSYGHPTNQTLSILKDANTKILRTDESGAIRCVSNGATFVCSAEK